ncbi:hypothetical protein Aca07nite_71510 [Actinoplanes capillaceus]|uniref:HTH-like domain-containing protein n=2 Tax=Actinoplanes campanulatus TaxID=113559 RepID=A0ABQ3WUA6_9ACTN|nr:hypothetical protein Aca07nite_71510 [Actinoplanes capillaceus]
MIEQVHAENYGVYRARKIWKELLRRGVRVARCTVERLMRDSELRGLLRDKTPRTTRPAPETSRPADLVRRDLTAAGPNQLWFADLNIERSATPGGSPGGAVALVGSKGDYDNAMAEAFNSLFKAGLVRNKGPWRGRDDLEMTTVEYIDWYNR